ncbi:MAG: hypothetical protein H0V66_05760, partial [Bdellovibrionales bacterium]|nr:hypothetical protein [Bdellovibrionales bacterium]
ATNWADTKTILMISVGLKFIPKFWGLKYSKEIMNWKWIEMFPARKLGAYTLLSLMLSVGSVMLRGFFKTDVVWFLVCGSIFAAIYLGLILGFGKKLARD